MFQSRIVLNKDAYLLPLMYILQYWDHPQKIKEISARTSVFAHSFFPHRISSWNKLPHDIAVAASDSEFIVALKAPLSPGIATLYDNFCANHSFPLPCFKLLHICFVCAATLPCISIWFQVIFYADIYPHAVATSYWNAFIAVYYCLYFSVYCFPLHPCGWM